MINYAQFQELIISPSLSKLQLFSDSAANLLAFTCAAESRGGTYLKQIKGPALGIYQMEPATYNDIWRNYIFNRADYMQILGLNFNAFRMPEEDRMIYDLHYATAMARLHYRRVDKPLPHANDLDGIWEYYKEFWNTHLGKAKKDKAIKAYKDFANPPQNTPPPSKANPKAPISEPSPIL